MPHYAPMILHPVKGTTRSSSATYVSKFVIEKEVLGALADFRFLPADELCLECLQHGGSRAGAVDEYQAQAACGMLQAKAGQYVGTKGRTEAAISKLTFNDVCCSKLTQRLHPNQSHISRANNLTP